MLELGLANTDARIVADKPVTPTFLFAILLWSAVLRELNEREAGPAPDFAQLMQACDAVLRAQQSRVAIPRRFAVPMRELLMLQPRFNRRSGIKSLSLLQHPRFRAAYDFSCCVPGRRGRSRARAVVDARADTPAGRARGARASAPGRRGRRPAIAAPGRRRRRRRRGGAPRSLGAAIGHDSALAPGLHCNRQQSQRSDRASAGGVRAHSCRYLQRVSRHVRGCTPRIRWVRRISPIRQRRGGRVDAARAEDRSSNRCSRSSGRWGACGVNAGDRASSIWTSYGWPVRWSSSPDLSLPHPGVSSRNFVLYPLCDIAPTLYIPGHGRVSELKLRSAAEGISVVEGK